MKLIEFPEQTVVIAGGRIAFCWKLSWKERLKILMTGVLWHEVLTFNQPLQGQKLGVDKPSPATNFKRNLRVQWKPNLFPSERRIVLTRVRWETGPLGSPHHGSSNKLSISLCFVPQDLWIGAFWKRESNRSTILWICLLPCLPIRFHFVRSWGGVFP